MIRDDAERITIKLQERLAHCPAKASGVTAAVEVESKRVAFAAPGGARPTFVRYKIKIADAGRVALLELDDAEGLAAEIGPDWGADRLFDEIRSRGAAVEVPGPPTA